MTFILVVRKIDMFDRSGFHLTELMSRNCFEAILTALSYVDYDPPVLLDHSGRFNSQLMHGIKTWQKISCPLGSM